VSTKVILTQVRAGLARYDPQDFELFMYRHFGALNRIFDRFDFDKPLNKEMSEAIFDYFYGRMV
jgi:hypothetical protein